MMDYKPFAPMFEILKTVVDAANADVTKIKAATADVSEAVDVVLKSSTDETITAWRAADEKGHAQIAAALAKLASNKDAAKSHAATLLPGADANFDVDATKVEYLAKRSQATAMSKALLSILSNDQESLDAGLAAYSIVQVIGFGRGTSTGGKGTTDIKRPRISAAFVNGEVVEDTNGKVSFTSLIAHLSKTFGPIDGDTVRKAAFTAANTDDLSSLPAGTEVEFSVTIKDAAVAIVVTTKGTPEKPEHASVEAINGALTAGE
jgi:hypothetical protein